MNIELIKSTVELLKIEHGMGLVDDDEALMSKLIMTECIDTANYAMMIADLHGHKFGK